MQVKVKRPGITLGTGIEEYPLIRRASGAESGQSFEHRFKTAVSEAYEEHIAQLAAQIDEQGRRLARKADMWEMERYRTLIAELLGEIVSNAYDFRREKNIDSRGRIKICATISKINRKLEEMAEKILEGNKDNLEIISRIDDIRGLIIDIML